MAGELWVDSGAHCFDHFLGCKALDPTARHCGVVFEALDPATITFSLKAPLAQRALGEQ
jgi:hypothetical protein